MKKKPNYRSISARTLIALILFLAAGRLVATGTLLALVRPEGAGKVSKRTLTFAERVGYQRAIEEVYWRHRIWPKDRPDPRPSLDAVMPQAQIEKKVTDYLRKSQALADYWGQPLRAEQLQAEMERIASHTKQPEVLRELFAALGNDPFVIAECLARPILAERLFSGLTIGTEPMLFRASLRNPAAVLSYQLPEISAPQDCIDDTWTATSIVNAPSGRYLHTAVWTGSEMIVWGGNTSGGFFNTGGRYNPATDSWIATSTVNAPSARYWHTAVWNGNEMIVWGGTDGSNYLNTGRRYNPNTDSWTPTSTTNAPSGRLAHKAVWTGSEMIVWGGSDLFGFLNTGGRYNAGTDSWTATSTTNAPSARENHTAVWSGSEMIVWGGLNYLGFRVNSGGRYNPSTDSWVSTCTTNAPSTRYFHTAIWNGHEMIVWGGVDTNYLNTGGRYNPGTDSWTATSTDSAPSGRYTHTAVWSGSEMIVWGGVDNSHVFVNSGGRYCAQTAPMAQSAFSRKSHGAAGTFDVPLPLTCNLGGIECRSGGATNDYQMIVNFKTTVTVGSASLTSGTGAVSSFNVSASQVTVNLTGVSNVQRITVTLFNVSDGTHMGNVPVSMGVLVGDVNGNAAVNASDIALTKSRIGQPVAAATFRSDVNADGSINGADVALVKSVSGTVLPP